MDTDELPRGRPFLTARWCNLILANFATPDELLTPHLPDGLQLDRRDGSAWCSIVAFEFRDTRVLGVPWPGYRCFPEVNLRFYVRHGPRRGVVFVREYVPSRLVAWIARSMYGEPYRSAPMRCRTDESESSLSVEHRLTVAGEDHVLHATGDKPSHRPAGDSMEHHFKEHTWGFGRNRHGQTVRYAVHHAVWDVFPVRASQFQLDWAKLYGPDWAPMKGKTPNSVILAAGSPVEVYPKGRILEPVEVEPVIQPAAQPLPG